MISRHVRRVDQLDSVSLDSELFALLNAQYRRLLLYIPSNIISDFGPELDVLFQLLFKYLPLKYLGCSFGHKVFDLIYYDNNKLCRASVSKLRLLVLISAGLPWFWERIIRQICIKLCSGDQAHQFSETCNDVESKFINFCKILNLINFCIFLRKSTFSTITERILNIRPIYSTQQDIKLPHFDGISRELLWHGISEFLGFTLPLINVFRIKNYLKHTWFSLNSNNHSKQRFKTENCLICGDIPNLPHTMGCVHVFCYYCIASMLTADPSFTCMYCKIQVDGLESIKAVPINRPVSTIIQK